MALVRDLIAPELDAPVDLARTLEEILEDVRCLARYAVETDQLPASVDIKKLYKIRQAFEGGSQIDDDDFGVLVGAYQALERRLGPVNVDTLHATEDKLDENGKHVPSVARRYVDYLFTRTILIIILILSFHLIHFFFPAAPGETGAAETLEQSARMLASSSLSVIGLVAMFLIPFLYGALGADAYLLRETTHKLHTRQFDPRRIPENRARFLLGTLSGGIIVLFVSDDLLQMPTTVFQVGGAALGFIAGFSTDFLFDTIDRIIGAILPRVGSDHAPPEDKRAENELLRRYRRFMDEAENEDEKKVLKAVVEDLEARAKYRSSLS